MPSYDYRCIASGEVFEVQHGMQEKARTWAELCQLGKLDPGNIDPDSPVERLLTTGGVVSSRSLKNPEPPCGGGGCGQCPMM